MDKIEIGKKLFDQTMGTLSRSLDVRTARHQVLSSNVANAETPNYAPKDLPFQKILERATESSSAIPLRKTHPQHFPEPVTLTSEWSAEVESQPGGEGVNIDQEMAKLAEENGLSDQYIMPTMEEVDVFPREAAAVAMKAIEQGVARFSEVTFEQEYQNAKMIITRARGLVQDAMATGYIRMPEGSKAPKPTEQAMKAAALNQAPLAK